MKNVLLLILFLAFSWAEAGTKLVGTNGVSQVEGASGGGIVPWAVISGYGQSGEFGGDAFVTLVNSQDFRLSSAGFSFGISNRVELSFASQTLDIDELGLSKSEIELQTIATKVRVAGDFVYDYLPQISVGLQHKQAQDFDIADAVGAVDSSGTDYYVSASRLWLNGLRGRPILSNVTLRLTSANHIGLLGFGGRGAGKDHQSLMTELSFGLLVNRQTLVGYEWRQKPSNLTGVAEDNWQDLFVAWIPNKRISVVAAWANLGQIVTNESQRGLYLSFQGSL